MESEIVEPGSGIDPDIAAGPEQPKKRRGRPAGSTNKTKAGRSGKLAVSPDDLAKQLQFIYSGIALMSGNAVWQLFDHEAIAFSKAILNAAEQYGINLFGGKTAALVSLLATVAMINIPRLMEVRRQRAAKEAEKDSLQNTDPHMSEPAEGSNNGVTSAGVFDYSNLTN